METNLDVTTNEPAGSVHARSRIHVVVDLYRPSTYEIIARWRAHAAGLIVLTFDRPSSRGTKVPIGRESAFSRTSADLHTADFIRSPFPRQMPSPRERVLPLTPIYVSVALRRKEQREDGENRSFPTCFDRTPRLITAPGHRIRTACNDFHSNAFRPLCLERTANRLLCAFARFIVKTARSMMT